MNKEEAAINQLKSEPLDAILMTHLDCDHVSGLKDFSGMPIYVSAEEISYARKNKLRYGKLVKGHEYKSLNFTYDPAAPFGTSSDVFGDGSVIAYHTPTHSAGSVIYKISEGKGFALVVGDNGYSEESWKQGLLPGPLYNAGNMRKCLAWIRDQSNRDECLGIFCAHDPIDHVLG